MPTLTPTPRTQAVYDEWIATKGKFGPDAHGCYQGLKIWVVMEELELEINKQKKRIEELETLLRPIDQEKEWWAVYTQKL